MTPKLPGLPPVMAKKQILIAGLGDFLDFSLVVDQSDTRI